MRFKTLVVTTILTALCNQLMRSENLQFSHLNVADGLSQSSVTALAQDSIGRIWIGTRDGLNLYDGSRFKFFRQHRGDANSLLGHFVNDIKIYGDRMWVVTKSGVSYLDIKNLNFTNYPKEGVVVTIRYKEKILAGTKNGLYVLNTTTKTFESSSILPVKNASITHLNIDNNGTLWLATDKGLYAHFMSNITVKVVDDYCTLSFVDSKRNIWVGTVQNGIYLLNTQRKPIRHFAHSDITNSILSNLVRDIEEDANGDIWVGTFKGLSIINGVDFSIQNYQSNDGRVSTISHNSIYTILRDKQNGMWLGTFFGGISYYNKDLYKQYEISNTSDNGTSYPVIGKIIEDDKSNLWVATEGGGLNYLDRRTQRFRHFKHIEGKPGLSADIVKALYLRDKKTLYIGTHLGGLNVLDITSGNIRIFFNDPKDPNSIPSNIVRDIIPYNNRLLLATDKGLVNFDPATSKFSFFFENVKSQPINGLVNCLLDDSFGTLWIGTEDYGLFAYHKASKVLKKYTASAKHKYSIGDNNITCIFEDHLFRLWIGTAGGGLNQYKREADKFEVYTIGTYNFPSNFILGIKESNYGNLWVATSKGLSRFDVERNTVFNYSQANGFPINELNLGSLYLTNNGELFVGGMTGLISFNEKKVLNQKQKHNITFETLTLNNKEVLPSDKANVLHRSLAYTTEIELKPHQNVFTIAYSACNYIKTSKNTYRYKLENFDTGWTDAGDQTSVTYTNLNPGTYTLIVQGISGVEGAVIGEKQLIIRVLPPIYRTWYAYLFYLIVTIIGLLWVKRMYRNKIILVNRIKVEQREKEQINVLNQSKLDFFTNISHEFRTPLTLISGTLEAILENPKTIKDNQLKLNSTYKNVVRLNNLVTELLDFRKLELGHSMLKVQEISLAGFLDDIYKAFVDYAHYHEIEFSYTQQLDVKLWFDKTQMEKVFFNLLSNAFKFVDDKVGKIEISIVETKTHVAIFVKDNGIGISKEKAQNIFDPYYQIDNIEINPKRKGSGIGLALCKNIILEHQGQINVDSNEEGTVFTIELLKGNTHYKAEDFSQEQSSTSSLKVYDDLEDVELFASTVEQDMHQQGLSILIVEDNPDARQLLRSIFDTHYKVYEAADGEQGVRMAIEQQPDLIISDVMMPKLTGIQLCNMLKRNIQTSHIPIVLLTAKATEEFKMEGLETGADDYITKPFSSKLLKAKVKNILHNRSLLQQKFKKDPTIKTSEIANNSLDQKFLSQAKAVVEKNIDKTEFVASDFAHEMGVGRSKLFDKIKGITGLTPNDFILSIRLAKASEMLLEQGNELTVSEIAYSVGFSSASYFSKCFKQYYGVTPTEYLANKKES